MKIIQRDNDSGFNFFSRERRVLGIALILFLAYALEMTSGGMLFKLILGATSVLGITLWCFRLNTVLVWIAIGLLLGLQLLQMPLIVANHHFVLFFICGIMVISHIADRDLCCKIVSDNARLLAATIMGMATLHKIYSPTYLDGNYIGFMWIKGSYFSPITRLLIPDFEATVNRNLERIHIFRQTIPSDSFSMVLEAPTVHYEWLVFLTVWLILAGEAIATTLLVATPRWSTTYYFTTVLVVAIAVARQELTFLCCYCFLIAVAAERWQPEFSRVIAGISFGLAVTQIATALRNMLL